MLCIFKKSLVTFALISCIAGAALAQVKQVQMKIDGYLCGN